MSRLVGPDYDDGEHFFVGQQQQQQPQQPRSIYYDEFRTDEVSEFTDPTFSSHISKSDFDPVGEYRKAEGPYVTLRRMPPPSPSSSRRPVPPPPPPPPLSRIPSGSGSGNNQTQSGDIEEYRDEFDHHEDYENNNNNTNNSNSHADEFVERVAEWYNQIEAQAELQQIDDDDDDDEQFNDEQQQQQQQQKGLVQKQQQKRNDNDKQKMTTTRFLLKVAVGCCFLFLITATGTLAVAYFMTDVFETKKNNDEIIITTTNSTTTTTTTTTTTVAPPTTTTTITTITVQQQQPTTTTSIPTQPIITQEDDLSITLRETFNGPESYGTSVAMDDHWMAVGAPTTAVTNKGIVSVFSYHQEGIIDNNNDNDNMWEFIPELEGTSGSSFGMDVDLKIIKGTDTDDNNDDQSNTVYVLVGAPRDNTEGTVTLFQLKNNNTNNNNNNDNPSYIWLQKGAFLQGKEEFVGIPEQFGSSIAMSRNFRCVVGAPYNDMEGMNAGRIYTFEYMINTEGDHQPIRMTTEPLVGSAPNARFGTDVDITDDGQFIVAGEPGMNSFSIYAWTGSLWLKVFQDTLEDIDGMGSDFGASVHFLSSNYVAIGNPLHNGGMGEIRIYQKDINDVGIWNLLPILSGQNLGDGYGQLNTISGRENPNTGVIEVIIGTAKGTVERYDLINNNQQWVRRFNHDWDHPVTSIASYNTDTNYMVLGGFQSARQAHLLSGAPLGGGGGGNNGNDDDNGNGQVTTPAPVSSPVSSLPITSPIPDPTTSSPVSSSSSSTTTTTIATPIVTTSPPPPFSSEWQVVAGPFTSAGTIEDTLYGHAVTLVGNFLAIGEPEGNAGDLGDVAIYDRSDNWRSAEFGFAPNTLQFGYSLASGTVNGKSSILVGAVDTKDESNFARFGSVHFYERDETGWNVVGDIIRPTIQPPEAGGAFGASVGMASTVRRIVVGAPSSSLDMDNLDTGRVYTFEYDGSDWEWMSAPMIGSRPGQQLGASVDMSVDGTRMLVGSPGGRSGDGTAYFYEWSGSQWNQILTMRGTDGQREGLGSTVKIISEDGKTIAFGGPNFEDTKGVIKVFQESESLEGLFLPVGGAIVGAAGEKIGTTLAGASNRIAFGTDTGSFRVVEYNGSDWVEMSTGPIDLGSKVISIDLSADATTVAVGLESQQVVVYELDPLL